MPTKKSDKQKGGRPSKLTPELIDQAETWARQGNYFTTIARCLGVSQSTFYRWLETGEADSGAENNTLHAEFWERIKKAEGDAERSCVFDVINGVRNWQCRAWFLERKYFDRWGRRERQQVEHTGKDGGPIQTQSLDVSSLNDDELRKLQTILSREAVTDS